MRFCTKAISIFLSVVSTGIVFSGAIAHASVEKIQLSRESVVDPETGERVRKVLNPSGDVTLTFTNIGLQLQYENDKKSLVTIQIYTEFPPAPPEGGNEQQNLQNEMLESVVRSQGKVIAGQMLRNIAASFVKNGARLILALDDSHQMGFVADHYDMSDVTLLGIGQSGTKLDELIFKTVKLRVEAQVSAKMSAVPREQNPIGFLWDQKGASAPLATCESMFAATQ